MINVTMISKEFKGSWEYFELSIENINSTWVNVLSTIWYFQI